MAVMLHEFRRRLGTVQAFAVIVVGLALCIYFLFSGMLSVPYNTIAIFALSALSFSYAAFYIYSRFVFWKSLQYFSVGASMVTLLFAVAELKKDTYQAQLGQKTAIIQERFGILITQAEVISDYCDACVFPADRKSCEKYYDTSAWRAEIDMEASARPVAECNRIKHFLIQMRRQFISPDVWGGVENQQLWAFNLCGNLGLAGPEMARLCNFAEKYDQAVKSRRAFVEENSWYNIISGLLQRQNVAWYNILALIFGVGVSQVTAEIVRHRKGDM